MRYASLDAFLTGQTSALGKGPIAMIFCEDFVEIESTVRHHLDAGFLEVLLFTPPELDLSRLIEEEVQRIDYNVMRDGALQEAVNKVIAAAPGIWMYYCYNAEYLFYPFCESRSVTEMLAFHTEERRDAMLSYVVDLYAGNLQDRPNAVDCQAAWLDRTGYYALARAGGAIKERQLDFFGGLRWRFEEHIPQERRKIDRVSLFKSKPGLTLRDDHTFSDEEYNTYACAWHHNLTAAICSFRTAKALKSNAGSTYDISHFKWHNSTRFNWNSMQLMELGLMEPGQWF